MTHAERILGHPAATEAAGAELARELQGVVYLTGPLGAGKTTLVRGIVAGLGGDPLEVASPTYALVHVYPTPAGEVVHVDLYRVDHPQEVADLLLGELHEEARLLLVEWPERALGVLPPADLLLELEPLPNGRRRLRVRRPHGDA